MNDESVAKSHEIMTIYFCFDLIELNADVTIFLLEESENYNT